MLASAVIWTCRFELMAWKFRDSIAPAAARYAVPAPLIAAVIWQETRFHPFYVGRAGELGLMQVMPASGQEWARSEGIVRFSRVALLNPATNVLAGTWYLRRAMDRWAYTSDPVPHALAEYNAGRSNALRWDRTARADATEFTHAISYPATQRYVSNIVFHARTYGRPWLRLAPALEFR